MLMSFSYMCLHCRMSCRECHRPVGDILHDLCHTHAYCARRPQYYSVPCVICEELWERARDLDRPEDAMVAFKALKKWIWGFRKNSRHRPKGLGHFYSEKEKSEFQELNAIHSNLEDIASSDRESFSSSRGKVSVILYKVFPVFLCLKMVIVNLICDPKS